MDCGDERERKRVPEVTFLWNEAERVSVNPEGESHHEQTRAKITRKEREDQAKMKRKADRHARGEDDEEIQSPRKKVIRVESEETQDYVRESLNLTRDEAEEINFVPCAISIPQKPMFWGDNRCGEGVLFLERLKARKFTKVAEKEK